jgi:hypothetical protein
MDQQLKSLNQAIVFDIVSRAAEIAIKLARLAASENDFTKLRGEDGSPADTVGDKCAISIPVLKMETPIGPAVLPVPYDQQPNQFVTNDGKPSGIFLHDLARLFYRCVGRHETPGRRLSDILEQRIAA